MTRIAVLDHGAGNLVSIAQSLIHVGVDVTVVTEPTQLTRADGIVLPGVGTTKGVMDGIDTAGFRASIEAWQRPLLGICVGMQVLFESSEEDEAACFGFMAGEVRQLKDPPRLPHIGWNDVSTNGDELFNGIEDDATFYFVHSFAPAPSDPGVVIATASYGETFAAAVRSGVRVGTQFHPERSGTNGLQLLANFAEMCA